MGLSKSTDWSLKRKQIKIKKSGNKNVDHTSSEMSLSSACCSCIPLTPSPQYVRSICISRYFALKSASRLAARATYHCRGKGVERRERENGKTNVTLKQRKVYKMTKPLCALVTFDHIRYRAASAARVSTRLLSGMTFPQPMFKNDTLPTGGGELQRHIH